MFHRKFLNITVRGLNTKHFGISNGLKSSIYRQSSVKKRKKRLSNNTFHPFYISYPKQPCLTKTAKVLSSLERINKNSCKMKRGHTLPTKKERDSAGKIIAQSDQKIFRPNPMAGC